MKEQSKTTNNMKNILFLITLVIGTNLFAQDFDRQKMDSLFTSIETNQKAMGSISIFEIGKETYQNTFGYASLGDSAMATEKTKYRIGSISKTFTAAIILKFIEDDKLSLTTTLSEFYPDIKNAQKITIEHLLKHRSGIFNYTSAADFQSWMKHPISKESLVEKIAANGSVFEPGEKFEYSNSNYVLLSFIAEQIEKQEFAALLQQTVCKPCGLADTYYGSKISLGNDEALSYTKSDGWQLFPEWDMSVAQGAGSIVSTPSDLNRFLNCLFTNKIVSEETVSAMTQMQDGYGLGLFQVPFYDKKGFGHNGAIDAFQANAYYFPPDKTSVALTANGMAMPINDIIIGALSIYFGKQYDLPDFEEKTLMLKSKDLDKYLGVYSSSGFPLKVTITKKENVLMGQATGQSSFPLEAYEADKFKFDQAGLKLEFLPKDRKMILRQGGGEFKLTKE
ncbi:MAG: serine hydrolase domain-containing protein [Pricia sp.]